MDLDAAREVFETSQDLTVGIEEEWGLVDPETLELVPKYEAMRADADKDEVLKVAVSGELISSEIEIRSGRGENVAARAGAAARGAPAAVRARRRATASRWPSTGTHPLSDYREQHIIDTEHYRRVQDGLQYVARRNNTFALQVHVGVQGGDRAIKVCDRLRPVLPTLLAISANSPFVDGRDSGLHSARSQTFTKSFPRCGIPDVYGSWQNWHDYVAPAAAHELDRRVHAAVVVGAPAPLLRDDRGPDLRRADDRHRGRRAGRADRRLRRPGAARGRRGRDAARPPGPPDRGEHVAGDPLRPGRQAARPRRPSGSRSTRPPRRSTA